MKSCTLIYKYAAEIPDALQRQHGAYLSSAKYKSDLNADRKFWLLGQIFINKQFLLYKKTCGIEFWSPSEPKFKAWRDACISHSQFLV